MTHGQQRARASAQHTLEHYVRILFEATGLKWDPIDNGAEIAGIVDDIIVAAGGEVSRT